ncbi:MAG: type II secretion system minor pseudopilin GspJ [Paraglaciecola sp.]|uniref:type II secretion system minor pseudopilin GspJ n=1 Tax=Paraglaciecola sp. TaxID=1920173 RepID=UPI00273D569C|nr:type II secretion system minor pseudopilin GspJ [Paraglaciecola sp.]MDP5030410.1 type II secretion system minor pseudopilin GspJ [Paraglaciecola sp.]MDP5041316.1 type II secretion system minor pseudopilin GspJ [Paraglaciecola sp.]MDP5131457.1 type II secretion system minor pseudopilin GspJ [Paraglaciecola sp.]
MSTLNNHQSQGFTLLEILVAMAIFTLIGIASTGLLTNVLDDDKASSERFAQLEKLQRAMLTIERDVLQAMPRAVRINGELNQVVMRGGEDELGGSADSIGFVHGGWHNPQFMLPRSTLQLVGYRLQDDKLQRLYGNYLDNVIGYEPKTKDILDGVSNFQVEFLLSSDEEAQWQESYTGVELPMAVAITLTTDVFGEIRREFLLASQ